MTQLLSLAVHNSIADVPPVEFSVYVKELHKDCDRGFSQQFTALQAHSPTSIPCGAAKLEKNRIVTTTSFLVSEMCIPSLSCYTVAYQNIYTIVIVADDSTRVILSSAHKKHSDYINASWINASSHLWKLNIHFSIAYRATRKKNLMWLVKVCVYLSTFNVHAIQCVLIRPLPETVGNFWRIVWQIKIPTTVMLTKTLEASKV